MPSEDFIRANGTEYKQIGVTDSGRHSARWFVLNGVVFFSQARGHMVRSILQSNIDSLNLYLVPATEG